MVNKPCSDCRGAGRVSRERKITVKIPPGIATGQQLRLQNEGESGWENLTVELHAASGTLVAATTTGGNGHYQFNYVAPGTYYIVVERPEGFAFTIEHAAGPFGAAIDSDVVAPAARRAPCSGTAAPTSC